MFGICLKMRKVETWKHGLRNKDMQDITEMKVTMVNTGIKRQVLEEIKELAAKYQIRKVILFGSRARGDYHTTSDIDLATTGGNYVRFALDVDDLTSTLLQYDVIDLDGAVQPELRAVIEKEGIILYEKV